MLRFPLDRLAPKLALAVAVLAATAAPARADQLWLEAAPASRPAAVRTLPDFVDLAAKLSPTVVNISTESQPEPASGESLVPKDRPFDVPPEERFGLPGGVKSLGSGFIINKAGYILTNDHVVENADKIVVSLADGRNYKAKLIGHDSKTDVALLKIDARGALPAAPLGDSRDLRVGQWVMAIGNPFGFDHSVTAGIISAKTRFIPGSYGDYIQTDASINPGNSGGPLIDLQGAVIGVNSAIYTRTGSSMGIGFAIPIDLVKEEIQELRTQGKVTRGWLGVYIQKVTPALSDSLGLEEPRGALVAQVLKDSPAMGAGLKRGDVIVAYDNRPIKESQELPLMVGETPVGRKVMVKFIRGRATRQVAVTITPSREEEIQKTVSIEEEAPFTHGAALGLGVDNLTPELARQFGISDKGGVVITEVQPGSSADGAGLRRHDIILEVDRQPIKDVQGYEQALAKGSPGSVLLLIERGGTTLFVPLKRQG
ncbi:MAG TPA: DegQ family serine endoprotease [Candidatus Binataceae bacterium]|jgi:serine protease Do|nr:DegQ family serine endoprotease [Candidatus Binataceae bacterium]